MAARDSSYKRVIIKLLCMLIVVSQIFLLSRVELKFAEDYVYLASSVPDELLARSTLLSSKRSKGTDSNTTIQRNIAEENAIAILYEQMKNQNILNFEEGRHLRFPSIQERVKFYASSWYVPPCEDDADGFVKYKYPGSSSSTLEIHYKDQISPYQNGSIMLDTAVDTDLLFHVRSEALVNCTLENEIDTLKRIYCPELFRFLMPYRDDRFEEVGNGTIPLIAQVGDAPLSKNYLHVNLPHMKKTRLHIENHKLQRMTSAKCHRGPREKINNLIQPLLMKIKFKRHFPRLHKIAKEDRPWGDKFDSAIFRGTFTGPNVDEIKDAEERCHTVPRCSMVQNTSNSSLVNAKFVRLEGRVPEVVGGVNLTTKLTFRPEQLKHKGLIMPEGNDVSSGLKWALLSNSVVLTGPPTATSWAMEALLEPWIHYVPLKSDLSDVEEKVQWVLDHDEEAQYIAKRGSLWIKDLLFHNDSETDNDSINREVLHRYAAHFRPM